MNSPTREFYTQTARSLRHDMSQPTDTHARRARSSRQRYKHFVRDYSNRRLDDPADAGQGRGGLTTRRRQAETRRRRRHPGRAAAASGASTCASTCAGSGRTATRVGIVFLLALVVAGLQMIEPLFMRFIIDRVLLNTELDTAARLHAAAPGRRGCSSA